MTFIINELTLTNVLDGRRTTSDKWASDIGGGYKHPFGTRTAQQATQFSIEFTFHGSNRYSLVSQIKDELKNKKSIFIRSTDKYLYGTTQGLWLTQTNFNITESAGPIIKATLTGNIDPYLLDSCDFSSGGGSGNNWAAGTITFCDGITGDRAIQSGFTSLNDNNTVWTHYQTGYPNPDGQPSTTLNAIPNLMDINGISFYINSSVPSPTFKDIRVLVGSDGERSNYIEYSLLAQGGQYKNIGHLPLYADEWHRRKVYFGVNTEDYWYISSIYGDINTNSTGHIYWGITTDNNRYLSHAVSWDKEDHSSYTVPIYGTSWKAQKVMVERDCNISVVQLRMTTIGEPSSTNAFVVSIREARSGLETVYGYQAPYGGDLGTGSITAGAVGAATSWTAITLDSTVEMTAYKPYFLVMRCSSCTSDSACIGVNLGYGMPQLQPPTAYLQSADSGATWADDTSLSGNYEYDSCYKLSESTIVTNVTIKIDDLRFF